MFSYIVLYLLIGVILNTDLAFVSSLQCYQCEFRDLPVNQSINPTLHAFESVVPDGCKTNLSIATNHKYCYINFYMTTYINSSSLTPQLFLQIGGSKSSSNQYYIPGQDAVQLVMSMVSHNVSSMNIFHRRIDYFCHTDQCNSVENIKSVLRAMRIDLDYRTVMNQLSVPLSLQEYPLQCSNYSNITSSGIGGSCFRCRYNYYPPPSPTSTCRRCETISCYDTQFCGSCSMYVDSTDEQGGYTIASMSHIEVHYLNLTNSLRGISYYCNTPNCNSLQKRGQVLSSYNFTFDMNAYQQGIDLSSTTTTTTTTATTTTTTTTTTATTTTTTTTTTIQSSISSASITMSISVTSGVILNTTLFTTSASVSSSSESTSTTMPAHSLPSTSVHIQTTTNRSVKYFVSMNVFILNVLVMFLTKIVTI